MWGGIRRWLFLKALAEAKRKKAHKPPLHQNPMADIHILYEISSLADFEAIMSWTRELKKSGKRVETLGFLKSKDIALNEADNTYTIKEIGMNHVPSGEKIQKFLLSHSDILVVLCHQFYNHLRYITYAHDSYFKIGLNFTQSDSYFNMMVESDPQTSYDQQIKDVVKSINKLSNNKKS